VTIVSYEYKDTVQQGESFSKIELGKVNLFVGASGSGKTRFLNTLFNFGSFLTTGQRFRRGHWKIELQASGYTYFLEYKGQEPGETEQSIVRELITATDKSGKKEILVDRNQGKFIFCNTRLPKLPASKPSVYLLKEEPKIAPLFRSFSRILRRSFDTDTITQARLLQPVTKNTINEFRTDKSLDQLLAKQFPLSATLYVLRKNFPTKFKLIAQYYQSIFQTIEAVQISNITAPRLDKTGEIPAIAIKQKGVRKLIEISQLSSGMVKVLLILTDVITMPNGSVYMIDEYENSLGINAIDFFPGFLSQHGNDNQFIITTHHPYLINNIPVRDWYLFNRKGADVRIKPGKELEDKIGKSKQAAFIQLINDPFYAEGFK